MQKLCFMQVHNVGVTIYIYRGHTHFVGGTTSGGCAFPCKHYDNVALMNFIDSYSRLLIYDRIVSSLFTYAYLLFLLIFFVNMHI